MPVCLYSPSLLPLPLSFRTTTGSSPPDQHCLARPPYSHEQDTPLRHTTAAPGTPSPPAHLPTKRNRQGNLGRKRERRRPPPALLSPSEASFDNRERPSRLPRLLAAGTLIHPHCPPSLPPPAIPSSLSESAGNISNRNLAAATASPRPKSHQQCPRPSSSSL